MAWYSIHHSLGTAAQFQDLFHNASVDRLESLFTLVKLIERVQLNPSRQARYNGVLASAQVNFGAGFQDAPGLASQ
jgi:hypothetical protein